MLAAQYLCVCQSDLVVAMPVKQYVNTKTLIHSSHAQLYEYCIPMHRRTCTHMLKSHVLGVF